MSEKTPAAAYLERLGLNFTVFTHPGPVYSLEQAAAERGQAQDQVVRSILFRLGPHEFVMGLVAGDRQISWQLIRKELGTNRISMANEQELLETTGCLPGAVTPLGLARSIPLLADPGVFVYDTISIGSGVRGTTILMQSKDLPSACDWLKVVALA